MWWDCFSQYGNCHLLPVIHRKRCDQIALHKMCNVTHRLLVIGKRWCDCYSKQVQCHSLAVGHGRKMWWDCLSQNVKFHSQTVGHRKRCDEIAIHKIYNVTHFLLVMEKMWWDHLSQNMQFHSLPIGHGKRCDEIAFTKCAMSLTSC